jgi:hypothetical protein
VLPTDVAFEVAPAPALACVADDCERAFPLGGVGDTPDEHPLTNILVSEIIAVNEAMRFMYCLSTKASAHARKLVLVTP